MSDLCKKTSRKISALARGTPFIGLSKRKLLINAFFYHTVQLLPTHCAIVVVIIGK